jgi:AcrR family transcriptional regulator
MNIAMINYYFGSKEKLFEALMERKGAATRGILDEIVNNKSLSGFEKLEQVIDSYVERLLTHRQFHRLIHHELILGQREELQTYIVDTFLPNTLIIKSIIDSGIRKNEFKKVDVELTISSLIGTINQVLLYKKLFNKLMNKEADYIPYDDPKFRKRLSSHLKTMLHAHLVKNN